LDHGVVAKILVDAVPWLVTFVVQRIFVFAVANEE
jgi:hypothetical protein